MDEDVSQKISRFIDDDMNADEALKLVKKIQTQPALKNKIVRYQIAAHALSNERVLSIKDDFLVGVQQGIANEPVYLLPIKLRPKVSRQTIVAIAASIALVSVLATRMDDENLDTEKLNTLSARVVPVIKKQSVVENKPILKVALHKSSKQSQNNRFNDYLQAHNTSLYTNGAATFLPYAQTASYR